MKRKYELAALLLISIAVSLFLLLYPYSINSDVLNAKGIIALKERDLMYISILLMLIVVIPVFILTLAICYKFRASNKKAEYSPEWDHDVLAESIWWGFPFAIVIFLSIVTLISTFELDPYRPLKSSEKPIRIQVVALQWKWLFLYPDEKVAAVNFFQFPEGTPLDFEITADAPMNSFWIPQLGGQIYAMPGMRTRLHLSADEPGEYRGSSANLSGTGFAGMTFIAKAGSHAEYKEWLDSIKNSNQTLDKDTYNALVNPSEYNPVALFSLKDDKLFDQILMKYMMTMGDEMSKSASGTATNKETP